MSATQRESATRRMLAGIAMISGIAVLAGCGGSSAPKVTAQQGQQTPAQSNADVKQTTSHGDGKLRAIVQKAHPTPATSKDDLSKLAATQFNPCKLVTVSEAQSITGGAVTSKIEAPLGPTCIYKGSATKSEITVTIESQSLSQVTHRMGSAQQLSVGTRRGYCGRLGSEMLYLPLASGKLLHITAPCSIAQQFAARALTRVTA
jgi:hypothetical protein